MRNWHAVAVLGWGQGGTDPPNLAQAPKFLIGSIVISLSRCCLPNNEGPGPSKYSDGQKLTKKLATNSLTNFLVTLIV